MSNAATYQLLRAELVAATCSCVRCATCHGSGTDVATITFRTITCDTCRGRGKSRVCARCVALEQLEEAFTP